MIVQIMKIYVIQFHHVIHHQYKMDSITESNVPGTMYPHKSSITCHPGTFN